jgi:hypothetical protein
VSKNDQEREERLKAHVGREDRPPPELRLLPNGTLLYRSVLVFDFSLHMGGARIHCENGE